MFVLYFFTLPEVESVVSNGCIGSVGSTGTSGSKEQDLGNSGTLSSSWLSSSVHSTTSSKIRLSLCTMDVSSGKTKCLNFWKK
ncbi:unnamed protein product, partial [Callosobruchus maculatus]